MMTILFLPWYLFLSLRIDIFDFLKTLSHALSLPLFYSHSSGTLFNSIHIIQSIFAYLPELGSDLVTALAALNVNDLSHLVFLTKLRLNCDEKNVETFLNCSRFLLTTM